MSQTDEFADREARRRFQRCQHELWTGDTEEGALRNLFDNIEEAQEELRQCRRQLRRTRALLDCYQAHASDETDRRAQQTWEHYCDEYPDEEAT